MGRIIDSGGWRVCCAVCGKEARWWQRWRLFAAEAQKLTASWSCRACGAHNKTEPRRPERLH